MLYLVACFATGMILGRFFKVFVLVPVTMVILMAGVILLITHQMNIFIVCGVLILLEAGYVCGLVLSNILSRRVLYRR